MNKLKAQALTNYGHQFNEVVDVEDGGGVFKIQWQNDLGHCYWLDYESRMAFNAAINIHNEHKRKWVEGEVKRLLVARKARRPVKHPTIGDAFPALKALKNAS